MAAEPSERASESRGTVVALIPDVFFSVTVRNVVRRGGFNPVIVSAAGDLTRVAREHDAVLAIVDATAVRGDGGWAEIGAVDRECAPVLVFGPHRDVDVLRRAKGAGVTRLVSNSQFHGDMLSLITRYARNHSVEADDT
ncbi:MAG TPA: hypothetical protein VMM78_04505 [Thermomicrobiales bacterium]|nr:hypothetical protein [Thermomicrobiales bacterium]